MTRGKHIKSFRMPGIFVLGLLLIAGFGYAPAQEKKNADKKKTPTKEICITFNELPAAKSFAGVDREAVTYLILEALKAHAVKATGFVVGENVETGYDLLGRWLNDGHQLGNMTYSNQDLHELGIEQYIQEIKMGAAAIGPMLDGFGQKKRYFRYPYLHYGITVEAKEQVTLYLEDRNYIVAHASVVPEDYLYNLSLEKLGKIPDSAEYENLMNEYINHVLDEIERVERLCKEFIGRPVRQILLLRANRLNAIYLEEMLTAIENMGYKFISLDRALKDEVYGKTEAYYDTRGLGYIDMLRLSDPDLLPAE
ncbi:MAG: polysaccharide deacetylase family protein [candidate division Zixibacteria bacterium]|nr:polysaccharide deacetylase family protein [candidate division Zixibacteria bacterium]